MRCYRALLILTLLLPAATLTGDDTPLEIVTSSGQRYPGATVLNVTPSTVEFGYYNPEGGYMLKGLDLAALTPELQEKFNYDPAKAAGYRARQQDARSRLAAAEARKNDRLRAEETRQKLKRKFAGEKVEISRTELSVMINADGREVRLAPVESLLSGTVMNLVEDRSDEKKSRPLETPLQLAGWAPDGLDEFSGTIYPTGTTVEYLNGRIPVYSTAPDDALVMWERYLDAYEDFALKNQNEKKSGDIAGLDRKGGSVGRSSDSLYWDSWWWPPYWEQVIVYPPRPPHPPGPPHPPRPPRPPKPPRPPRAR